MPVHTYYLVLKLHDIPAAKDHEAVGWCPVFLTREAAEEAWPHEPIIEVESIEAEEA